MTTTTHRKGGTTGGNQYGAYKVRYASDKQVMFIKTLLTQKAHNEGEIDFSTLNVQGATDLIKKLLSLPLKEGYVFAPSEKQINFLKKLVLEKEKGMEYLQASLKDEGVNTVEQLSRNTVSGLIGALAKSADKPIAITEVGAYLYNGVIYSIRKGNESGKWQVWDYDNNQKKYLRNDQLLPILKELAPDNRLTLEQAIKHSVQTGVCCHCGRTLTQLKSVAGGIGPICAKKYR